MFVFYFKFCVVNFTSKNAFVDTLDYTILMLFISLYNG